MQVVAVDPVEVVLSACDHVVPQVHSSTCDGVIEAAMCCRLTE